MKYDMNRREFVKLIGIGAAGAFLGSCGASENLKYGGFYHECDSTVDKPNFVFIFADDQGYADLGCYGAEGFETPNIDRMADEGMKFTDFYAAAPVCSPTRASLMTGCYPQRVSMPKAIPPNWKIGLHPQEITIAEILKTCGYATACFGKWHLGDLPGSLPNDQGFDEFFGLLVSHDMTPDNPEHSFAKLALMENKKLLEYGPDPSQLTTWYTQRSIKFIEENKDGPFFLYLPHSMPHVPLYVSDKYKGKSEAGLYGDVIMEIDWSVGEVLSTLKRLGIDDKTLVVYASDNGPANFFGNHGGSAKPLRGGKGTTFEGGMREPCIMRWPGVITPGTVCSEIASTNDIMPTFAKLAGSHPPTDRIIDGRDISRLMKDPNARGPHEVFYYLFRNDLQAVRCGKWKLHLAHKRIHIIKKGKDGKRGKYTVKPMGRALFDLENDIAEQHNVIDQHPDIVKRLMALAEKMVEDIGDSSEKVKGKNVRATTLDWTWYIRHLGGLIK